jgi:hypothetical protein
MEEYIIVNRFMERYEMGGHRMVRSRDVRILVVESFVLKKRECENEEEGSTHEGVLTGEHQHSWHPSRHVGP